MVDERDRYFAGLVEQTDLHRTLEEWNRLLGEIDERLMLVKADENSHHPALKAGYYHVIRDNGHAPPSVIVHEGPDGEFLEPNSSLLERLRAGDMWSDRSLKELERKKRKLQRAAEKRREREKEDRIEEVLDRAKAAWNPGVRIPKAIS